MSVRGSGPGFWQLLVEDRGPGIPAAQQRKLFKPFTRLGEIDPDDDMSSGLGLSLARQIVASAGGQLWYEDRDGGSEEHTSELQSLMRTSYAVFCLQKKTDTEEDRLEM